MDHDLHPQLDDVKGGAAGKSPTLVIIVRALFYLNAMIWLLLGGLFLNRMAGGLPGRETLLWIIFGLMLANALVMLWIGWSLRRPDKRFYYLGIAALAVNIILSITDEFGWLDLATLLVDVILLGLLIATRSKFNSPRKGAIEWGIPR